MGSLQAGGWESAPEQGKETLLQLLCFSDPQVRMVDDGGKDYFFVKMLHSGTGPFGSSKM